MIIRYPSPPFVAAPCLSDQKQPLPRNIWSTHLHQQEVPEQRIKVEQSDQSTLAIRSSVRRGKTWRRAKRENVKGWNDLIPMWRSTKATHRPNWISNVEANILCMKSLQGKLLAPLCGDLIVKLFRDNSPIPSHPVPLVALSVPNWSNCSILIKTRPDQTF